MSLYCKRTFEDSFNLLCGAELGSGLHRRVFECRLRPDLVVKVEHEDNFRNFANIHEDKFFSDHEVAPNVARWLAPTKYLSPDGRILLQARCKPYREDDRDKLPKLIPSFLTDVKLDNFGWLDGNFVCHDYAFTIPNPSLKMKKVEW